MVAQVEAALEERMEELEGQRVILQLHPLVHREQSLEMVAVVVVVVRENR